MKKVLLSLVCLLAVVTVGLALDNRNNNNFTGENNFEGPLKIDGTEVTATAAELNHMDGITSSVDELNILDGVTATASDLNGLIAQASFALTNITRITIPGATLGANRLLTLTGSATNSYTNVVFGVPGAAYTNHIVTVQVRDTNLVNLILSTTSEGLDNVYFKRAFETATFLAESATNWLLLSSEAFQSGNAGYTGGMTNVNNAVSGTNTLQFINGRLISAVFN